MWESLWWNIVTLALNLDLLSSVPRMPSSMSQAQGPGDRHQPSGPKTDQGIQTSIFMVIKFSILKRSLIIV